MRRRSCTGWCRASPSAAALVSLPTGAPASTPRARPIRAPTPVVPPQTAHAPHRHRPIARVAEAARRPPRALAPRPSRRRSRKTSAGCPTRSLGGSASVWPRCARCRTGSRASWRSARCACRSRPRRWCVAATRPMTSAARARSGTASGAPRTPARRRTKRRTRYGRTSIGSRSRGGAARRRPARRRATVATAIATESAGSSSRRSRTRRRPTRSAQGPTR
mmetsp:Transcript_116496/g.325849  ORF Transcript_116496/g.325849 Transcript_116496/m.325849 type:complete len:221 (+) Transcript_116496:181-843(+)